MADQRVREAFRSQAALCTRLGSPFTGRLCEVLAATLDRDNQVGRHVLDWPGAPGASGDNVPLRLCGALHALVRGGRCPRLASLYPPAPLPDQRALAVAVAEVLAAESEWLDPWLDRAPQTNEIARSTLLMAGLLKIASRFSLPMRLYELGASAGLNLLLDRFGYDLGGVRFGDRHSKIQLNPRWQGNPPPQVKVRIAGRAGVDISPMDGPGDGERLLAYVWPDQPERLERTKAALKMALSRPTAIAKADAADWIERQLDLRPVAGSTRVIMHSIAFQYFPPNTQARVAAHIAAAGEAATAEAPLAWLRFEWLPGEQSASLRVQTWPGEDKLLAWAHPHGSDVTWL